MTQQDDASPGYSIAAVSKLTGVSCHVLRVWERRYGFPVPHRSESGHRRYTHDQVGVLRHLARLTFSGHPIGELIESYRGGRLAISPSGGLRGIDRAPASVVVDLLFSGDVGGAEAYLDQLGDRMAPMDLVERIIEPALVDVGDRWFRGDGSIFQDRCAHNALLGRVNRLLEQARRVNREPRRRIVVGAVQGDRHEGAVALVSLALELAGWRAISLGVDLPVEEFARAVRAWKPDALGLSFVLSRNIVKRFAELAQIRDVPVFVGGRSLVNHQALARRHGLIPLVGALSTTVSHLAAEAEIWCQEAARGRLDPVAGEAMPSAGPA